jgi:hypothetical protein
LTVTLFTSPQKSVPRREYVEFTNFASQSRVAFSSIARNTCSSSPGDELINPQHICGRRLWLGQPAMISSGAGPKTLDNPARLAAH